MTIARNIEHEIYLSNAEAARYPLARWIYRRESRLIKAMEDYLACTSTTIYALTEHDAKYLVSQSETTAVIPFNLLARPRLPQPHQLKTV